jgi:EPS I polysaccharide export inner membrane protein EpsE
MRRFGSTTYSFRNLARVFSTHPLTRHAPIKAWTRFASWQVRSRFHDASILPWVAVMTVKLLRSRTVRSTLWTSLAVMCSRGSVVFALMCAARLLDIEDFGRLMVVQSTCVVFQNFFIIGFVITAPKLIADLRHRDPKRTAEVIAMLRILGLALGLAVAGLLVILAPQIAGIVFGRPELSQLLRIASVISIVMTWHEIQMAIINGFEAFDLQARVAILAAPVGLTVFLSATWLGGLQGSVLGLMAMFAVAAVVSTWSVSRLCRRHAIPIRWWSGSRDWSTVCRIALPAALSGLVWGTAIWIANAFLVNSEDGLAQFGLFSLAYQFFAAVIFLPNMVTVVVMPAFSRQLGAGQREDAGRLLRQSVLAIVSVVGVAAAVIGLSSPWIMKLYSHEYATGWLVLTLLMVAAAVMAPQGPAQNFLAAKGWMWTQVWINGLSGLVLMGLAFFTASYGAIGLALAYILYSVVKGGLLYRYGRLALEEPRTQVCNAVPVAP